jgi:hypothetical protein
MVLSSVKSVLLVSEAGEPDFLRMLLLSNPLADKRPLKSVISCLLQVEVVGLD